MGVRVAAISALGVAAVVLALASAPVIRGWASTPESQGRLHEVDRGEPARGAMLLSRYGCGTCHTVPGVPSANGRVGPSLEDFADQAYIAGMIPNTPENLVRWIRNPKAIDSNTLMPNLGVSEHNAWEMTAYLATLN